MIVEDQAEVVALLAAPATHGGAAVERVETHGAIVFMAGDRAWKLKRAVRYDYMDFSTPVRRRVCCEAEVRLNRRTAPDLYLGVVPVTRTAGGGVALGGDGPAVDWVVEMRRFDQAALLEHLGEADALDLALMGPLAAAVARFHAEAAPRRDQGGRAGMARIIEGNADGLDEFGGTLDPAARRRAVDGARAALVAHGVWIDERREAGFVRQCHGDLHLRNIVLLDGVPTIFDALEFNDEFSCIDTHYDLAFLVMDLWHRGLSQHANAVWNGYLARTGDLGGIRLAPLFLSCRATVLAKTSATAASLQDDPARRRAGEARAAGYLALADRLLSPPPPGLVAIGGFSGTGKSTVARGLAPGLGGPPGAVVLRSDEVRKALARVGPLTRLGPEAYSPSMHMRVYGTLLDQARTSVRAGHTVILDAVFAHASERQGAEAVAREAGVPFVGLWLDAPEATLVDRVNDRTGDTSDADARVVRAQVAQGAGPPDWVAVDAARDRAEVLGQAVALVRARGLRGARTAPAVGKGSG